MFTDNVRQYSIDLSLNERDRWQEVIRGDLKVAREITTEAATGTGWFSVASLVARPLYAALGGRYTDELKTWAEALGISVGKIILLNCAYEASHLSGELFGCTAGVKYVEGMGMVHVRSLDWPLSLLGKATRVFLFKGKSHEFVSVGITGYVGVLSGMVPGAYSATINWAPPDGLPSLGFGPAFLLRDVLETCQTYEAAVKRLAETPLATSVFYTVCGTKRGQACVIERTKSEAAVREMWHSKVLTHSNHHAVLKFFSNNHGVEDLDESMVRSHQLAKALTSMTEVGDLEDLSHCLDEEPVFNDDTGQQMVFCPTTGKFKVWRWEEE